MKPWRLLKKLFFYTVLGFIESSSGPLDEAPGRIFQKLPGAYKSGKPNKITGIVKVHFKCAWVEGSKVKEVQVFQFCLR